jgi:hypothetical protein
MLWVQGSNPFWVANRQQSGMDMLAAQSLCMYGSVFRPEVAMQACTLPALLCASA